MSEKVVNPIYAAYREFQVHFQTSIDENGLFTPFVKFLKIYSVTFFGFTSISHEKLDPIESFEVGITGLD